VVQCSALGGVDCMQAARKACDLKRTTFSSSESSLPALVITLLPPYHITSLTPLPVWPLLMTYHMVRGQLHASTHLLSYVISIKSLSTWNIGLVKLEVVEVWITILSVALVRCDTDASFTCDNTMCRGGERSMVLGNGR